MEGLGQIVGSGVRKLLPVVHADSAPLHAVGTDLVPLGNGVPDVRMANERVEISLFPSMAVVEATFELANDGPATTIPVGFPAYGPPGPFKSTEAGLMDFQASVGGQPCAHVTRTLDNVPFPAWFAWTQTFPARATSRLSVRYWTPLLGYAGASRLPFIYVLRTGRFWKGGRIGKVDVVVRATGIPMRAIREATPEGYDVDHAAGELRWSYVDHVPDEDVGLLVSPLELLAHELGQRVLDPLDVHEASPAEGTRLTVLGTPDFNPFDPGPRRKWTDVILRREPRRDPEPLTGWLMGERRLDRNIVMPDGIASFHASDDVTSLRLVVSPATTTSRLEVASHHRGWWKALLRGTARRDHLGPFMDVAEWTLLDITVPPVSAFERTRSLFPWVTGSSLEASASGTLPFESSFRSGSRRGMVRSG